jgi:hypothetical protein
MDEDWREAIEDIHFIYSTEFKLPEFQDDEGVETFYDQHLSSLFSLRPPNRLISSNCGSKVCRP